MSQVNAYEQYMLELINADRAKSGAQPLASDGDLNESAENHSAWMISTDTFSHTGAGGSDPGARIKAAGYSPSGWAENIAWMSTRSPAGLQNEVEQLHTNLMNSPGHRANLLNDSYREIGVGFEVGQYRTYEGAFVTQNFGRSGSNSFVTGVAIGDADGDKRYDIGEGLGNITVSAKNNATSAVTTTTTNAAGGYELSLASGNYTVNFSGSGAATTKQVSLGSKNIKLDLVNAGSGGGTPTTPTEPTTPTTPTTPTIPTTPTTPTTPESGKISGTAGRDTLDGTPGNDVIAGLDGSDRLYGNAGNDKLDGGSGNDRLYGGSGNDSINGGSGNDIVWGHAGTDILTGGTGQDDFVFNASFAGAVDKITDYSSGDDMIYLENGIFTSLRSGDLSGSAFHTGSAAHDSTDRIIYDAQTGALYYDGDGTGGASAQQFAQLTAGIDLTNGDFYVI
jgi:Ca2+-binding RTX toxin-like protein